MLLACAQILGYKSEDSLRHRSFTRFNDLPVVNQRSLIVPKVHLPPRAFRRIHEGFDGRLECDRNQFFLSLLVLVRQVAVPLKEIT
jgi:hypothetical protein